MSCQFLNNCSFFSNFSKKESILWRGMIMSYCHGKTPCARKEKFGDDQEKVPYKVLPTGKNASAAFLSLP